MKRTPERPPTISWGARCFKCDGYGTYYASTPELVPCDDCNETGRDMIPWNELFPLYGDEAQ